MSGLSSIRIQVIIIIALLMVVPVLVFGGISILYYQDVVKHNIWDNNLAQAKAISALTANYVDLSTNYLKSIADRPLVIKAVQERNLSFLNDTTQYSAIESLEFDTVFITDTSGTVLSYNTINPDLTNSNIIGKGYSGQPYIGQVLKTSSPSVDAMRNNIDGSSAVYIGVPIMDQNNTTIGVIVGALDMNNYSSIVTGTQVKNSQYIYLVNESGNVIFHNNKSYMANMTDFSMLPAVREAIQGHEGVTEQEFPFENSVRLSAYAPVPKYGWGVVVSLPVDVAYQPITQFTWYLLALIIVLLLVASILAVILGHYLTNPLLRMSDATTRIPDTDPEALEQYLPLRRKDEIGNLARAFLSMANTIRLDRERIISARDQADEEKHHAELYLDIMGHDINNMNQMALINLELVKDDATLSDDERRSIEESLNVIKNSTEIIDNVRVLQKINEKKMEREKVDINGIIMDCIKEAPRPEGKKVAINYEPKKDIIVEATPLVKEIFRNLIGNSIKYSGDEVTIDIGVAEASQDNKKYYDISVADNGFGIPDGVKPKLFGRFQRGTTKTHGKGLGLYIVRMLAEMFGGSVKVEDRVAGDYTKGTKVIVTLPSAGGE